MFESIEELEKEVQSFRENLLASNELITGIEKLTATTSEQQVKYVDSSKELLTKIDDTAALTLSSLIAENEALIDTLSKKGYALLEKINAVPVEIKAENVLMIDGLKNCISELQTNISKFVSQLSNDSKSHLNDSIASMNLVQQEHIARLEAIEIAFSKGETELTTKYDMFMAKLESTNVDQLLKACQDIQKAVNMKFAILSVGLSVSVILLIVSFFIK